MAGENLPAFQEWRQKNKTGIGLFRLLIRRRYSNTFPARRKTVEHDLNPQAA